MPVVVVGVVGVLVFVGWLIASQPARDEARAKVEQAARASAAKSDCLALANELAARRGQGADVNEMRALEMRVQACARDTGAMAVWQAAVDAMRSKRRMVTDEWANYRTTADVDAIKRNNIRGTWLRLTDEYVGDARAALAMVRGDRAGLDALVAELWEWVSAANDRAVCFGDGAAPCSRYGLNEPHNVERATDEIMRGLLPVLGSAVGEHRPGRHGGFIDYIGEPHRSTVHGYGPGLLAQAELAAGELAAAEAAAARSQLRASTVTALASNPRLATLVRPLLR